MYTGLVECLHKQDETKSKWVYKSQKKLKLQIIERWRLCLNPYLKKSEEEEEDSKIHNTLKKEEEYSEKLELRAWEQLWIRWSQEAQNRALSWIWRQENKDDFSPINKVLDIFNILAGHVHLVLPIWAMSIFGRHPFE